MGCTWNKDLAYEQGVLVGEYGTLGPHCGLVRPRRKYPPLSPSPAVTRVLPEDATPVRLYALRGRGRRAEQGGMVTL